MSKKISYKMLVALLCASFVQVAHTKSDMPTGENIKSSLSFGNAIVGHKGNILESSLNKKDSQYIEKVYNVMPGVYSLTGFGIDNINVIEGKTGIIVIDGGMTPGDAEKAISMLPKKLANKKVTGMIYTHWHYIFGAAKWNVDKDTVIVAHENHSSELQATFGASKFKQLTQVRGAIQLGAFLPKEGPDAAADTGLVAHQPDTLDYYLEPTKLVGSEETKFVIDGVTFVTHAGFSDTKDSISVYLPEKKVSIDNVYWAHGLFNISTLRGDKWRDPKDLIDGGKWLLSKDIKHSLKVHGKPVDGKTFKDQLMAQNDFIEFFTNAVTDGMARGLSPDELQYEIKLPSRLANNPHLEQNYGEFSYHVRRYYAQALHFFGNDSVDLHPLPRNLEAQKMVAAMGGVQKVKNEAEKAYKAGDYQWSAQLATYAIRVGDAGAKQIKANALRAMAQVATASNTRNWYLTHALVLEGKVKLPIVLKGDY